MKSRHFKKRSKSDRKTDSIGIHDNMSNAAGFKVGQETVVVKSVKRAVANSQPCSKLSLLKKRSKRDADVDSTSPTSLHVSRHHLAKVGMDEIFDGLSENFHVQEKRGKKKKRKSSVNKTVETVCGEENGIDLDEIILNTKNNLVRIKETKFSDGIVGDNNKAARISKLSKIRKNKLTNSHSNNVESILTSSEVKCSDFKPPTSVYSRCSDVGKRRESSEEMGESEDSPVSKRVNIKKNIRRKAKVNVASVAEIGDELALKPIDKITSKTSRLENADEPSRNQSSLQDLVRDGRKVKLGKLSKRKITRITKDILASRVPHGESRAIVEQNDSPEIAKRSKRKPVAVADVPREALGLSSGELEIEKRFDISALDSGEQFETENSLENIILRTTPTDSASSSKRDGNMKTKISDNFDAEISIASGPSGSTNSYIDCQASAINSNIFLNGAIDGIDKSHFIDTPESVNINDERDLDHSHGNANFSDYSETWEIDEPSQPEEILIDDSSSDGSEEGSDLEILNQSPVPIKTCYDSSKPYFLLPTKDRQISLLGLSGRAEVAFQGAIDWLPVMGGVSIGGFTTFAPPVGDISKMIDLEQLQESDQWYFACSCNVGCLLQFSAIIAPNAAVCSTIEANDDGACNPATDVVDLENEGNGASWVEDDWLNRWLPQGLSLSAVGQLRSMPTLLLIRKHLSHRVKSVRRTYWSSFAYRGTKRRLRKNRLSIYPRQPIEPEPVELLPGVSIVDKQTSKNDTVVRKRLRLPNEWTSMFHDIVIEAKKINVVANRPIIVLVCGDVNTGKSTFTKSLINWSLSRRDPLEQPGVLVYHVDTDTGQSEFSPSGCVTASRMDKPILCPPFAHSDWPNCSLWFGDVHPGTKTGRYLAAVKGALAWVTQDYSTQMKGLESRRDSRAESSNSQRAGMVVVNCNGWMKGMGAIILKNLIDIVQPDIVCQLGVKAVEMSAIQRLVPPAATYKFLWSVVDEKTGLNFSKPFVSSDLRNMAAVAYFGSEPQLLNRPYLVRMGDLAVNFVQGMADVNLSDIFKVLNASVVALCRVEETELGPRINDDSSLPSLCLVRDPLECFGFGLIRSIDVRNRLMFISTPVDGCVLKDRVNVLSYGNFPVPFSVMAKQELELDEPPYLCSNRHFELSTEMAWLHQTLKGNTMHLKRS